MTDIIINPTTLSMNGSPLVDLETLALIERKGIELKLHVSDSDPGNAEKPVLVLIHGNSSSKRVFDSQKVYYQEKYRVLAIDLIGHGQSTKLNELPELSSEEKELLGKAFYSLPAMVGEVAQVLQKEHIEGAHFIGWSLGGHIAYGLTVETPELVSSIVTIGSPPVKFSPEGLISGFSEWFVRTLVPQWVDHPAPTSAEEANAIRQHMGFDENDSFFVEDMMTTDPLVRRHLFLNIAEYENSKYENTALDGASFARDTDIPLCLLVGDKDVGINHQVIKSFSEQLNNAHSMVHIIPQAQHAVFKTNPDEYHNIVDGFLETVSEPSMTLRFF